MLLTTNFLIKKKFKDLDLNSRIGIIIIQHLLNDTELFLHVLKKANFQIIKVFGIEYSSREMVRKRLRENGIEVDVPKLSSLRGEIKECIERISVTEPTRIERVVIHEVGGYFADIIYNAPEKLGSKIVGIVEETKQGLWRYEKLKKLNIPVIHIADSGLKNVEGRFVGEAIIRVMITYLKQLKVDRFNTRFGILGYGVIGKAVAESLRKRKLSLLIYDKNPVRRIEGRIKGFNMVSRSEIMHCADVIIGSSGSRSIQFSDLKNMKNNVILASASSRELEFPVKRIRNKGRKVLSSEYIGIYSMPWGKSIRIINDGFPINFKTRSLPMIIADLMFSQISLCIYKILNENLSAGLHRLSEKEEEEIAIIWLKSYDMNPLLSKITKNIRFAC